MYVDIRLMNLFRLKTSQDARAQAPGCGMPTAAKGVGRGTFRFPRGVYATNGVKWLSGLKPESAQILQEQLSSGVCMNNNAARLPPSKVRSVGFDLFLGWGHPPECPGCKAPTLSPLAAASVSGPEVHLQFQCQTCKAIHTPAVNAEHFTRLVFALLEAA